MITTVFTLVAVNKKINKKTTHINLISFFVFFIYSQVKEEGEFLKHFQNAVVKFNNCIVVSLIFLIVMEMQGLLGESR